MRRMIWTAILSSLLLTGACAQRRWDYRDAPRARDQRFGNSPVSRVLGDLDRARSYRNADGHERKHFENARRDLMRFQDNWMRGKFDRDRLDGAIENIDHLVGSRQIHPRDREILARDLSTLRDFRSRGGYNDRERWPR